jgi:hypothetical protein
MPLTAFDIPRQIVPFHKYCHIMSLNITWLALHVKTLTCYLLSVATALFQYSGAIGVPKLAGSEGYGEACSILLA